MPAVTKAEVVSTVIAGAMALTIIFAYALDAAGLGVLPLIAAPAAVIAASLVVWRSARTPSNIVDAVVWAGAVLFVFASVVRLGWPSLLPPGRGPDLTHHLLLVDYIEQHHQLVHDRSLDGAMGEMAHYTPGAHLLAVIVGSLSGIDGLRAFFPLLAFCAAMAAGFVYLIARRLDLAVPYAIAGVLLLFLPAQYFYGAFTHDGFLAQAAATFFAVAAWWAFVVWDHERTASSAALFSTFIVATFLTWPVFVGPLLLVFAALALRADQKVRDLAIVILPLAIAAAIHLAGRVGWLVIVRTSGAVLQPSIDSVGWLLPLLALAGIHISVFDRKARTTIVLLFAIVLQAATLFAIAKTQGADTPYMAFKMVYLAIYPMAVLGALGMSIIGRALRDRDSTVAWLIATVLLVIAVRPALTAPRAVPVVDLDLYAAGKWARTNIGRTCVDYLVADAQTAYWLHLAVLGNPRASARMQEIDVYEPRSAIGAWITAEGRGYAIADLQQLPDEVRSRVEIVRRFGNAVVLRMPGATPCYDGRL